MLQINASIVSHHKKIWCAYRTQHLRHYNAECFLSELNADLEPVSDKRLIAENDNTAFEDIRLFSFNEKLLAFYNYLPFKENIGWERVYGVGYGEVDVESGLIKNQVSLRGLSKKTQEQNWSPYVYNDELFMVTDFEPFLRLVKIAIGDNSTVSKEIFLSAKKTRGWNYGTLKGGTPLLNELGAKDGWHYGFVHSCLPDTEGFKQKYYYTVIRYSHLNKTFEYYPEPLAYSDEDIDDDYIQLWKHSNGKLTKGVFPVGIMPHDEGVVVSFGKDEVVSYTEYFSWQRIKDFFRN